MTTETFSLSSSDGNMTKRINKFLKETIITFIHYSIFCIEILCIIVPFADGILQWCDTFIILLLLYLLPEQTVFFSVSDNNLFELFN